MEYIAFGVVFILLSLAVSVALHYFYVRKSYKHIPMATHGFLVASLFVCIVPFPLLVLDVHSGRHYVAEGLDVRQKPSFEFFHSWWLLVFFATQVLAWIILPIAQEYDVSGAFTPMDRLRESIKSNVKMYIVLGVVVGALFAYVIFLKGVHTFSGIVALALAAANAFGLCLLVIFMSCGMVGLPKALWRKADPALLLRYYYYNAVDMQEELDIIKMDLAELKSELVSMDPRAETESAKKKLMTLLDIIDETTKVVPVFHSAASRAALGDTSRPVDEAYLIEVSTRTRKTTRVAMRLHYQWETLQRRCLRLDAITSGNYTDIGQNTVTYWTSIRKPLLRGLGIAGYIMTILVAWSELMLPLQAATQRTLSVAELVAENETTSFFGSCIFLFYMAISAYWATFQFKVFNVFQLVAHHSDAASLCFVCTFLTRLILPLCYNFLWISDLTGATNGVTYSTVFGRMDVVDVLGPWFNRFLPVGIPILCVLLETKFFDKLMESAGIDRHDPCDIKNEVVRQKINDGRALLSQTLGKELREPANGVNGTGGSGSDSRPATPTPGNKNDPAKGTRYAEWKAKRAAMEAVA